MSKIENVGEVIRKSMSTNGYPYSEDQLNLVEERTESHPTVYTLENPKKFSLVLDPSWIEETFEKFEYAKTNLYVSPKNDKNYEQTKIADNNNYLDYNYNKKMKEEFDVKISQKLPAKLDNFKVIVNVRLPTKIQRDPYPQQVCPTAATADQATGVYYDNHPIDVKRLKMIPSRLIDAKSAQTGSGGSNITVVGSSVVGNLSTRAHTEDTHLQICPQASKDLHPQICPPANRTVDDKESIDATILKPTASRLIDAKSDETHKSSGVFKEDPHLQICPQTSKDLHPQICPPTDCTVDAEPIGVIILKPISSRLIESKTAQPGFQASKVSNGNVVVSNEDKVIMYLDSVINEHESNSASSFPSPSKLDWISFDVKIVAKPPEGNGNYFRTVVPVILKNANTSGRS